MVALITHTHTHTHTHQNINGHLDPYCERIGGLAEGMTRAAGSRISTGTSAHRVYLRWCSRTSYAGASRPVLLRHDFIPCPLWRRKAGRWGTLKPASPAVRTQHGARFVRLKARACRWSSWNRKGPVCRVWWRDSEREIVIVWSGEGSLSCRVNIYWSIVAQ